MNTASTHWARRNPAMPAVLAVALFARVAVVLASPHYRPTYDAADYVRLGHQIASGHDMTAFAAIFHHGWTAFRAPLYPLFAGGVFALGGGLTALRLAGAVMGVVAVGLFGATATTLWNRRAGLCAAALSAVLPSFILLSTVPYSEVLFLPGIAATLWCTARSLRSDAHHGRWAVAAGAAGGVAVLARPNGLILLVGLLALLLLAARPRRERLIAAGLALAAVAVVIAPWVVRNEIRFHRFIPTTDAAGFDVGGVFNATSRHWPGHAGQWLPPYLLPDYAGIFHDQHFTEPQLTAGVGRSARSYLVHHPGYAARVAGWNSLRLFGATGPGWTRSACRVLQCGTTASGLWFFGSWALLLLAVVLAPYWWRRRREVGVLLAMAAIFWVSTVVASGDPRYREPIEAMLVLAVAAACSDGDGRWLPRRRTAHRSG